MAPPVTSRTYNGVVVSAGKMFQTVKVRIPSRTWNKHIKKYFSTPKTFLVSDPNNSTRTGDIVAITSGYRKSKNVRHVVSSIVSAFGTPVSDRPALMTLPEYEDVRARKRLEKDLRQATRGREASAQRANVARVTGLFEKLGVKDPKDEEVVKRYLEKVAAREKRSAEERESGSPEERAMRTSRKVDERVEKTMENLEKADQLDTQLAEQNLRVEKKLEV